MTDHLWVSMQFFQSKIGAVLSFLEWETYKNLIFQGVTSGGLFVINSK